LPFRKESFDVALSIHTFAHINDPDTFLGEIARVMRSGTEALLEYPNSRSLVRILRYGLKAFRVERQEYLELFFGTHPKHFASLCNAAGLRVLATRGSGYLWRLMNKVAFMGPVISLAEAVLMRGPVTAALASRNFARVEKMPASRLDGDEGDEKERTSILDLLVCPSCHGKLSMNSGGSLTCADCALTFEKIGAIYDMRYTGDAEVRPFSQSR